MLLNTDSELAGKHAFLAPSTPHWLRYSDDKLERVFTAAQAAARGDRLHKLAHDLIDNRVKLPDDEKTLNLYVNEGIGFRMQTEVPFVYSTHCFGHADTASFRQMKLRISDLKTGSIPAKVEQLEIYAALFCLQYRESPFDIEIELRIYQSNEVREYIGDPVTIDNIKEGIKAKSAILDELRKEMTE